MYDFNYSVQYVDLPDSFLGLSIRQNDGLDAFTVIINAKLSPKTRKHVLRYELRRIQNGVFSNPWSEHEGIIFAY